MVSRQETARPLLTPGEVMQLPPDEAVIQVSGLSPIRARKIRYFADEQLSSRVSSPPALLAAISQGDADSWKHVAPVESADVGGRPTDDEGGLQLEPELPGIETAPPAPPQSEQPWIELDEQGDEAQQAEQSRRFRSIARQASLDPDDGIPL